MLDRLSFCVLLYITWAAQRARPEWEDMMKYPTSLEYIDRQIEEKQRLLQDESASDAKKRAAIIRLVALKFARKDALKNSAR